MGSPMFYTDKNEQDRALLYSEIAALKADVARLTEERDLARACSEGAATDLRTLMVRALAAEDKRDALKARVEELESALAPLIAFDDWRDLDDPEFKPQRDAAFAKARDVLDGG